MTRAGADYQKRPESSSRSAQTAEPAKISNVTTHPKRGNVTTVGYRSGYRTLMLCVAPVIDAVAQLEAKTLNGDLRS
ncbi:hypothetical protein CEPID_02255 [Corynebacterium epidermidicanis]|uniref:Uncharacterized protein n=1 Tax=Corynebacterium epidermidicanis TaxID=1050174 RepID=A0A0G3GU02_9CORY|nr:hypothetical protein CEPID_02255 [Corynebacterium epidermidicanis]